MAKNDAAKNTFYEFFAGSGMVRAGLGSGWDCMFANDLDEPRAASYEQMKGLPTDQFTILFVLLRFKPWVCGAAGEALAG